MNFETDGWITMMRVAKRFDVTHQVDVWMIEDSLGNHWFGNSLEDVLKNFLKIRE